MKQISIAVTGIGGYGSFYTRFLLDNPYDMAFRFASAVDPYAKSSEDYQELLSRNIPIYDTMEEFYQNDQADLMIISTPLHLHKPQSEIAMKNGSNVLCEKPTSALLSDVFYMKELEQKYKKDLFIGFQLSFTSPILNLKNDLMNEKYGKVIKAKAIVLGERDFKYYNRGSGWAGKIRTAAGTAVYDSVASNATAHYLHNLLFLLGDTRNTAIMLKSIAAQCQKANEIESFDTCVVKLKTVKDQELTFIASHATKGNIQPKCEICCENAVIRYEVGIRGSRVVATLKNGDEVDYGNPLLPIEDYQKIIQVVNWISGESAIRPPCDVDTTIPFTTVINEIFENVPFEKFAQNRVVHDESAQRVYVDGLFDELSALYQAV